MNQDTDSLNDIQRELFRLQDANYRNLQIKLIPAVLPDTIIGVKTPVLRKIAKQMHGQESTQSFLDRLPHQFFDENQLHAFILSEEKDYKICISEVNRFLPFINNWATCDQLSPKCFRRHRPELFEEIRKWRASSDTYTVRFGIGMLMEHFLDEDFDPAYPDLVAEIRSDEYYINMMIAWYFATALVKQYQTALSFIESRKLDVWTHNKTIQKATESSRLSEEQKECLRKLRI